MSIGERGIRRPARGMALIVLLLVLGIGALVVFTSQTARVQAQSERNTISLSALVRAKEALIARAVLDTNRPGSLPCPDTDGDGSAELFSGNRCPPNVEGLSNIGRLPYRTLGLPDFGDASGERLWYALSASLRDHPSAEPINSDTPTDLTVNGVGGIAAVLFAPGAPLAGQNHRPSNAASDYLDAGNAISDKAFTAGPVTASFNDVVLTISRTELMGAVARRVLAEVRGVGSPPTSGLRGYYDNPTNHAYPWAATTTSSGLPDPSQPQSGLLPHGVLSFDPATLTWLQNNNWLGMVSYAVAPSFQAGTAYPQACGADGTGCLSVGGFKRSQARVALGATELPVCTANPQTACP